MWRAFFLAIGLFLMILGAECLAVSKVTLRARHDPPPPVYPMDEPAKVGPRKILKPASWAPWSLLSSGAVVCLYSFTIPKRVKGD